MFGAGKSFTLIALVDYLSKMLSSTTTASSILICAATNTAVDRILCGLLHQGCNNIARVGSVKKIAKEVGGCGYLPDGVMHEVYLTATLSSCVFVLHVFCSVSAAPLHITV